MEVKNLFNNDEALEEFMTEMANSLKSGELGPKEVMAFTKMMSDYTNRKLIKANKLKVLNETTRISIKSGVTVKNQVKQIDLLD